jgi:hypothetical protein
MLPRVNDVTAWAVLGAASALFLVAAFPLRTRLHPRVVDALLAISGAGIAVGGLLFLDDVGPASWAFAPLFLGMGAIAHVRALFAGAGPFRT